MDYFRAIAAEKEYSERALDLTEDIIRRNPAHYTVWYVIRSQRRSVLRLNTQYLSGIQAIPHEHSVGLAKRSSSGTTAHERVGGGKLEELSSLVSHGC